MKNLRVVNLVLLVLYFIYAVYLIYSGILTFNTINRIPFSLLLLTIIFSPIHIYITIVLILTIINLFNRVSKPIINNRAFLISILIFILNFLLIFYSLFSNWIFIKIIGILVIIISIYQIYLEIQLSSPSAQNLDNSSFKNDSYMDNYIQENQEEKSTEGDFTQKIKNYYK